VLTWNNYNIVNRCSAFSQR